MSADDNRFRPRPGTARDRGRGAAGKGQRLAALVRRASARAGYTSFAGRVRQGTGAAARGRRALARIRFRADARRVVVKARVVRHKGLRFRSAPLARHITYLEREGVTRDGRDAAMFDARSGAADRDAFAQRCEDDRHHFRFIVSPEDAPQMDDLRDFTRRLMATMASDLETRLDWIAVDHWNTDNPHIHVLVRGVTDAGSDLVIDKGYISAGMRARAEERVTLELGPRSELEMRTALEREVEAERWTSLDRQLQTMASDTAGIIDLRPGGGPDAETRRLLLGRAARLEAMGLAAREGAGLWSIEAGAEQALRDLSIRGDIIKTMHRALNREGTPFDPAALALHERAPTDPVTGRLVERGLHDELTGEAYAVIDGADGHTHHLRFDSIELTGDAPRGAIVEARSWDDTSGRTHLSLATRSDIALGKQVAAPGATWLDRQLLSREPAATGNGFGLEVRAAMEARAAHLESMGLARRQGQRLVFTSGLIETLRSGEIDQAVKGLAARSGLAHKPSGIGEYVSGIYRERVTLSSGRFAMIDDGLSFQLVPWRPALDQHLGRHVTGTMSPGGAVDWALGRGRGPGL